MAERKHRSRLLAVGNSWLRGLEYRPHSHRPWVVGGYNTDRGRYPEGDSDAERMVG